MANIRRRLAVSTATALLMGSGVALLAEQPAQAHGANIAPGSRTYLCFQNGGGSGDIKPTNPACAAAVASSTTQPLWDWYGVLRSDGAGRMAGYIDDGQLCSGGNPKYADYDAPRADWPLTRLTGGAKWTFRYNAWAPHPGQFRLYVTKDGYDPTKPLKWSDLESEPFSVWDETVPNGNGEYFWDVTLPNKSGRHIIYSVWARTDSKETFYNCSDVSFDGGKGEVDYNPKAVTTTPTTTKPTTTTTQPTTTTTKPTTGTSCAATYSIAEQWNRGFQADLFVTNTGSTPLSSWKVTWTYADGQKVTQFSGAKVVQTNKNVVVTPAKNAAPIEPGGRVVADVTGTFKGTNSVPKITCTAAGQPTKTTKTTKTTKVKTTKTKSTKCKNTKKCGTSKPTTTKTTKTTTSSPTSTSPKPTTTTPSPTQTVKDALLNDGFESQTGGAVGGGWTVFSKNCSGAGTASIDTTTARSGSKSLKINGVAGYCNHVMAKAPVNLGTTGKFFVRAYVKHTTALPAAHTTFIAMTDANDSNKELRIGGQNQALQWNRESDDATLPAQSPAGVALSKPLPTGDWQCLEFTVDSSGKAMTWLNGTEVAGLTADGEKTRDVDDQWFNKAWSPKITDVAFGWESYGDGADTLWYDDVVVSSSRIGC